MDVTRKMALTIVEAMNHKGFSQKDLAEKVGHGEPWISRLISGGKKTLSDADLLALEKALDVELTPLRTTTDIVSKEAIEISRLIERDEEIAQVVAALISISKGRKKRRTKKQLERLGLEILKISDEHKDSPVTVAEKVTSILK